MGYFHGNHGIFDKYKTLTVIFMEIDLDDQSNQRI